MKAIRLVGSVVVIAVLIVLSNSLFTVTEGFQGIVLQLGKMKTTNDGKVKVYQPGIHVKTPFINSIKIFDTRVQGFSTNKFSTITSLQTFLEVEYYAKWRVSDLSLYYTRTGGSPVRAEQLLEPKINDILRAAFGKHTSDDIISAERGAIMAEVLSQANEQVGKEYGITLLDVRIEQVALPTQVMKSVFNRMGSERKQFANNKRAEGLKASEAIKAQADQEVVIIKAKANEQAAKIKASGEEKAAGIYADAYGVDPKFYALYRSLEAYKQSFEGEDNVLVISPDSQFYDYFKQSGVARA
jgi:modulator of FtsH protease HflC